MLGSGKILILENRGVADLLKARLTDLKIEATTPEELGFELLTPTHPNSSTLLGKILSEFVKKDAKSSFPNAPCIHPGVGAWATRPELVHACQKQGLELFAPPNRVLTLFNNQLNLISEAERLGISNLVLSFDPLYSAREFERVSKNKGWSYPVILKSIRGKGGPHLFVLRDGEYSHDILELWFEQLRHCFGEKLVFAEKYLSEARQIVVPFVRFQSGELKIFPLVDSSLQSRNRKIVEFCPAQSIDSEMELFIHKTTATLAEGTNFVGLGFLEFMVDSHRAYFLGGSARLNTSFPIWEKIAGVNALAWQLAALNSNYRHLLSETQSQNKNIKFKAGVSVRIFSEDSLLQLPQPGLVKELSLKTRWNFPGAEGYGVHLINESEEIDPTGDGMTNLLFAFAQDREQTLLLIRGILDELWIAGSLQTNERYLSELLNHPWVKAGMYHSAFCEEEFIPQVRPTSPDLLTLFSSVCFWLKNLEETVPLNYWSVGDQWVKPNLSILHWADDSPLIWAHQGMKGVSGHIEEPTLGRLRVCAFPLSSRKWIVRMGAWTLSVRHIIKGEKPKQLLALATGRIHSLYFQEKFVVPAHEPLLLIESLQTLIPHALPSEIQILKWNVKAESFVHAGQALAEFEVRG